MQEAKSSQILAVDETFAEIDIYSLIHLKGRSVSILFLFVRPFDAPIGINPKFCFSLSTAPSNSEFESRCKVSECLSVATLPLPDGRDTHRFVFLHASKAAYISISLRTIPLISNSSCEVHRVGHGRITRLANDPVANVRIAVSRCIGSVIGRIRVRVRDGGEKLRTAMNRLLEDSDPDVRVLMG
jgi:hypothetical protein